MLLVVVAGMGTTQMGRGGGGKSRITGKLQNQPGTASVTSSFFSQPRKTPASHLQGGAGNQEYHQGYDGAEGYREYDYDYGDGSNQLGEGYSRGFGYEGQSAYGNKSDWGYDESGDDYGGMQQTYQARGGQGYDGGAGQRGHSRGQTRGQGRGVTRGQFQQRGRGRDQNYGGMQNQSESQTFGRGSGGYQSTRGRGRGRGQGQGTGRGQGCLLYTSDAADE